MKVVLLCAGYATRLYPLTQDRPKALLAVAGKPILEYLIEKLEPLPSVDRIFLVTNDRFYPQFKNWIDEKHPKGRIEVVNDGTRTNETRRGAIGDLIFILERYQIEDDLGVFAGDNLFHSELGPFFQFAESHRPHGSVGVVDVGTRERATRYGVVRMSSEGRIVEFREKPPEPDSTWASTGIYWFPRESLKFLDTYLSEGHNADRPGDYLEWLVKVDRIFAYPFQGDWFDVGDLRSYEEADERLRKQK